MDSRLSYSAHIEGVRSRFRQRVVLLSYMAKYLSPDIVDKLYKGYVRPVVEYSSPLWHSRLTTHQSLTPERLQVRVALQLLVHLGGNLPDGYRTSKSDLLERVCWPSLTWRRHIDSMRLFHHFFPTTFPPSYWISALFYPIVRADRDPSCSLLERSTYDLQFCILPPGVGTPFPRILGA